MSGRVNASVGGAAGGTGLIGIAQHLGGTSTWPGVILLYCAPAIAIVFGGFIDVLQLLRNWAVEQQGIWQARRTLKKELKQPYTTEQRKAQINDELSQLDALISKVRAERVRKAFAARR